eukprot:gene3233-13256_t
MPCVLLLLFAAFTGLAVQGGPCPEPKGTPGERLNPIIKELLEQKAEPDSLAMKLSLGIMLQHFGSALSYSVNEPRPGAHTLEMSYEPARRLIQVLYSPWLSATWRHAASGYDASKAESRGLNTRSHAMQANLIPNKFHEFARTPAGALLSVAFQHGGTLPLQSEVEEQMLHTVMAALYRIHQKAVSARGHLENIHVSKAAGSTICMFGEKDSCNTKAVSAHGHLEHIHVSKADGSTICMLGEKNSCCISTWTFGAHPRLSKAVSARGHLEHIHVSKAAGSTICMLGEMNSCNTKVFGPFFGKGNCLISEFGDMPSWVSLKAPLLIHLPINVSLPSGPPYHTSSQRREHGTQEKRRIQTEKENGETKRREDHRRAKREKGSTSGAGNEPNGENTEEHKETTKEKAVRMDQRTTQKNPTGSKKVARKHRESVNQEKADGPRGEHPKGKGKDKPTRRTQREDPPGEVRCDHKENNELPPCSAHMDAGFPSSPRHSFVRFGELRPQLASCALRKRVLDSQGWNFYSNEYTALTMEIAGRRSGGGDVDSQVDAMLEAGLCSEMAYLMVFRHPYVRLISHIKYVVGGYLKMYKSIGLVVQKFSRLSTEQWKSLGAPGPLIVSPSARTLEPGPPNCQPKCENLGTRAP